MSVKEELICRLCLKTVENESEVIDETVKEMLEGLLLEMNWDLSENPIMCENCGEFTRKSFYFKSNYIDKQKLKVYFSGENNRASFDLKAVYKDNQDMEAVDEDVKICRFCMEALERNNFVPMNSLVSEQMLPLFIPQVGSNTVQNSFICYACRENLDTYFKFVSNCLDTEKKLKKYSQVGGASSKGRIKLSDILPFLFEDVTESSDKYAEVGVIKNEPLTFEDKQVTHFKVGNNLYKTEELYIKDEHEGSVNDTEVSFDENVFENLGKIGLGLVDQGYSETKMYKHKSRQNDSEVKGKEKAYQSKRKGYKGDQQTQMYRCADCTFETKLKASLKHHALTHKNASEIETYKCTNCTFETKRKGSLTQHMSTHKQHVEMYNCPECTYKTNRKSSLNRHKLIHKDASEIETYRCPKCTFETKHKKNVKDHMRVHKDASEIEMYRCARCTFETRHKGCLTQHMFTHKDASEMETYKCGRCTFETKRSSYLKRHMLIHMDASEVEMYKCAKCTFETKRKYCIRLHVLTHINPPEVGTYRSTEDVLETN